MECYICHSGLYQSTALFLLTTGDLTCSQHFPTAQMPAYDFTQDPHVLLFANLLYTVATFSQGNSVEIRELVMPIEKSVTKASADYVEMVRKQYCVQASSWTCTNCNYQNAKTNPICWQCRVLPGTVAPRPFQGTIPVLVDEVNVTAETWKCPREGCGQLHWNTEKACHCGYQNLNLVESKFEEEEEKSVPPASVMPVQMQNTLWACPCGYEYNRNYEETCTICKKCKPGKEERAKMEENKAWICPLCGEYKPLDVKDCNCGYSSQPKQSYQLPSQQILSKDSKFWICTSCQYNKNIESYTHCRNCQLKRVTEGSSAPPSSTYSMDMTAQMYPSPPALSSAPTVPEKKFETCLTCGFSNPVGQTCICTVCPKCREASRQEKCKRCGTSKPPPLCRLCQNKADEAGLCKTCAARTGQEPKKESICLVCFSMGCTVHH